MSDIENLTIMFTDIVGFSSMVSSLSRTESELMLQKHDKLLEKVIKRFGGNIIKSVGDSFLVVFRSPTDATLCSMAIHDTLWATNKEEESNSHKLIVRIALNTGEVRLTNGDIFGEAVNIAARLESKTPAGAIYLTESVYLSMNKNEVLLEEVGKEKFKGIPQPVTIYQAKNKIPDEAITEFTDYPYSGAHQKLKPASRSLFTFGRLFVGLSAALIAAFFSWWLTIRYMPATLPLIPEKLLVDYNNPNQITERDIITFETNITAEISNRAKPLITQKNYASLATLIDDYRTEYPHNTYLTMLQAHVDMHHKKYESAIRLYATVLKENAALAENDLLSRNLVRLLSHQRLKAYELIAHHLSQPMIASLARRTGQSGLRARYDALYLLKDSGNIKKVDVVGLNMWDLRELQECKLKKIAIKELRRLNDPRALPALKETQTKNILKQFKYWCIRSELPAAIAQLEGDTKKKEQKNSNAKKKEKEKEKKAAAKKEKEKEKEKEKKEKEKKEKEKEKTQQKKIEESKKKEKEETTPEENSEEPIRLGPE